MGKVQGKGGVVKGDDSDGPKWPAPVRVEVFLFFFLFFFFKEKFKTPKSDEQKNE